jgi:hypothetical protein
MGKTLISNRMKVGRVLYLILGLLFAFGVILQVMLAGMALFFESINWIRHVTVIHLFGFNVPILMLITTFVGKMPRWAYWQVFGVLILVFLMYFTANIKGALPIVAALHPVIAMILFMFSLWIVFAAWKLIYKK